MSETDKCAPVAGDIPVTCEAGMYCLDLREIDQPPRPLVAIVELIERCDADDIIRIQIARDPVNLYPELVERGWAWTGQESDGGEFHLILRREQPDGAGPGA